MRLALLTDGIMPYYIGGMPKLAHYLSKHFAYQDVSLTLIHCVPEGKKLISNEEVNNLLFQNKDYQINSICLPFPKSAKYPGHYVIESKQYAKRVYNAIKDQLNDFDFIYAKGFTGYRLLKEKEKGLKCPPVIVQMHGLEMFQKTFTVKSYLQAILLRPMTKYCLRHSDYIFSYGGRIRDIHLNIGIMPEKLIMQYGSVPREKFRGSYIPTTKIKKILFIARNERRKAIPELHKVIKNIITKNDFELNVIGPIPEKFKINHKKVVYHNEITQEEQYFKIIKKCDILLLPSITEGFPTVAIEAMSQGLCVFANDVGAISFAVNDKNGWLIPLNFNFFEKKLIEVLNLPAKEIDRKKELALQSIKNKFFWDISVTNLLNDVREKMKK